MGAEGSSRGRSGLGPAGRTRWKVREGQGRAKPTVEVRKAEAIRGEEGRLKLELHQCWQRAHGIASVAHNPYDAGGCAATPQPPGSSDSYLRKESGGMEGTGLSCGG